MEHMGGWASRIARATNTRALPVADFYAGLADYVRGVDPTWEADNWCAQLVREREWLGSSLGRGDGKRLLDCSCGDGGQAIPLAELDWQVTAADVTVASLARAQGRAREMGLDIAFAELDMRRLGERFREQFDQVITCMALDNITEDDGILQALCGMREALKPGGGCYVRLRDMDNIMSTRPRYEFREERRLPNGRVIRLEDWIYESQTHVICVYVFLHEDRRREGYAWEVHTLAWRRRALRKAELGDLMAKAGFEEIRFLPQSSPWYPYEVLAVRPRG